MASCSGLPVVWIEDVGVKPNIPDRLQLSRTASDSDVNPCKARPHPNKGLQVFMLLDLDSCRFDPAPTDCASLSAGWVTPFAPQAAPFPLRLPSKAGSTGPLFRRSEEHLSQSECYLDVH